jgi:hypothetical protein
MSNFDQEDVLRKTKYPRRLTKVKKRLTTEKGLQACAWNIFQVAQLKTTTH